MDNNFMYPVNGAEPEKSEEKTVSQVDAFIDQRVTIALSEYGFVKYPMNHPKFMDELNRQKGNVICESREKKIKGKRFEELAFAYKIPGLDQLLFILLKDKAQIVDNGKVTNLRFIQDYVIVEKLKLDT